MAPIRLLGPPVVLLLVLALTCLLVSLAAAAESSSKETNSTPSFSPSPSSSPSAASSASGTPKNAQQRHSTATQQRQSSVSAAASVIGALGSLVPSLISNVAPLVMLIGFGAMLMPSLGLNAMGLLRESRRSGSNDQLNLANGNLQLQSPFLHYAPRPLQPSPQDIYYFTKRSFPGIMGAIPDSAALQNGFRELLERVSRAIDNADRRYN